MEFYLGKCDVMYFWKSKRGWVFTVNYRAPRNVGEHWSSSPLFPECGNTGRYGSGEAMWSACLRESECKSWYVMLQLYKALVRLYMEYCVESGVTVEEGSVCTEESTEETHKDVVWIGGL